jgi:hypothetical protein
MMDHVVKVRGRMSDPRHIELDEPLDDLSGPVDVVVTAADVTRPDKQLAAAAARMSDAALKKVWDNPEDDAYDNL